MEAVDINGPAHGGGGCGGSGIHFDEGTGGIGLGEGGVVGDEPPVGQCLLAGAAVPEGLHVWWCGEA